MFERFLSLPINFFRVFLLCAALLTPVWMNSNMVAGMFGISIPANYGKWFTSIYDLYVQNQDLIASAREMYSTYLAMTQNTDALKDMGDAKDVFLDRWEENVKVLTAANVYWNLEEHVLDGRFDVQTMLQQLFGIEFQEDQVTIRPEIINLATIAIIADKSKWQQFLLDQGRLTLPSGFMPDNLFAEVVRETLSDQSHNGYNDVIGTIRREASDRIYQRITSNPMLYLNCAGFEPCWTPFYDPAASGETPLAWSWEEMLELMFDHSHELHDPMPLPGEVVYDGSRAVEYDQYLHRRLCSAVWRALGQEIKEKIMAVHHSFAKRRQEIQAAVADVRYLSRYIQNLIEPLDNWAVGDGISLAKIFATSFKINADGVAERLAEAKSFIDGMINKKLAIVLERAEEVGEQVDGYLVLFDKIRSDIITAEKEGRPPRSYRHLIFDPRPAASSLMRSPKPLGYLLNCPRGFRIVSHKVHMSLDRR